MSDASHRRAGALTASAHARDDAAAPAIGKRTLIEASGAGQDAQVPPASGSLVISATNSAARHDSNEPVPRAASDALAQLRDLGYTATIVAGANVLNERPNQPGAAAPNGARPYDAGVANTGGLLDAHGYDMVVNGGFYDNQTTSSTFGLPLGSVMRDGQLDNVGMRAETDTRGALAILEDGTMLLGTTAGRNREHLEARFGQPRSRVSDVIAGGIMIVESRAVVTAESLQAQQISPAKFENSSNPFNSAQHTAMGVRDGVMFAIAAQHQRKTAIVMARELAALGFSTVLLLDGGSGFHVVRHAADADSNNPVSIGIKSWGEP